MCEICNDTGMVTLRASDFNRSLREVILRSPVDICPECRWRSEVEYNVHRVEDK